MKRGLKRTSIDSPVCRVHKRRILQLGGSGVMLRLEIFGIYIAITRLDLEAINQILYCTERLWVQVQL